MINICTLRNGSKVPEVVVKTTMIALDHLLQQDPLGFYDLAMSSRDPDHRLPGNAGDRLKALGLIEGVNSNGTAKIHEAVRNVVASAVDGAEINMQLRLPVG